MDKELKSTIVEITRSQKPENFRRDQNLIDKRNLETLRKIDKSLRELSKLSMCKKQAE